MAKSVIAYDKELPEIPGRRPWERPTSFLLKDAAASTGWREDTTGRRPSRLLLVSKIRTGVNEQQQEQTKENRQLSQTEIEKFVAINQEAATSFEEVQRDLHERELRLTEMPTSLVLVPICVLGIICCGIAFFLKALNQRALATVEHVLHLAPEQMVREVVRRHAMLESPRASHLLSNNGDVRSNPQH